MIGLVTAESPVSQVHRQYHALNYQKWLSDYDRSSKTGPDIDKPGVSAYLGNSPHMQKQINLEMETKKIQRDVKQPEKY